MAHELHKTVGEILGWAEGPMTHLEYLVWQQWLQDQWNEPNRSDYYAMALMHEVRYSDPLSKRPRSVSLREAYGVPFEHKEKPKTRTLSAEEEAEATERMINRSRAALAASVGYKGPLEPYKHPKDPVH